MEINTMKNFFINTDGAYHKAPSKRSTVSITDDIGQVIKIGYMSDTQSVKDVGSIVSKDFTKGVIIIRSFRDNQLHSYDMDCTNSTTYDADDLDFMVNSACTVWKIAGGIK